MEHHTGTEQFYRDVQAYGAAQPAIATDWHSWIIERLARIRDTRIQSHGAEVAVVSEATKWHRWKTPLRSDAFRTCITMVKIEP